MTSYQFRTESENGEALVKPKYSDQDTDDELSSSCSDNSSEEVDEAPFQAQFPGDAIKNGYTFRHADRDGSCMFHSILLSLTGISTSEQANTLRQEM